MHPIDFAGLRFVAGTATLNKSDDAHFTPNIFHGSGIAVVVALDSGVSGTAAFVDYIPAIAIHLVFMLLLQSLLHIDTSFVIVSFSLSV